MKKCIDTVPEWDDDPIEYDFVRAISLVADIHDLLQNHVDRSGYPLTEAAEAMGAVLGMTLLKMQETGCGDVFDVAGRVQSFLYRYVADEQMKGRATVSYTGRA